MKRINIKKITEFFKQLDYKHYINLVITLVFSALGVLFFPNSPLRVAESARDIGTSFAYYFCEIWFDFNPITPTVTALPSWQLAESKFEPLNILPYTFAEFRTAASNYWTVFFDGETFSDYLLLLSNALFYVSQGIMLLMPLILTLYLAFKKYLEVENNDYDVESDALIRAKRLAEKTYIPLKFWIIDYIDFCRENSFWLNIWLFMWSLYFNVIAIIMEFIAYYLYFIVSFDLISLYGQIYKLILDLTAAIRFIPVPVWVVIITVILELVAEGIAYNELNHRERKNMGFLSERGVMTIVYGPMGSGKTKLITDMALSEEVRQRNAAFEIIIEEDFKFPYFNYALFEQDLKSAFEAHTVFSLSTVRKWISEKKEIFENSPELENIWSYDFLRYGYEYNDGLKLTTIWESLEKYACAYLIYTVQSSLLVSNYSIRVDNLLDDIGNFPRWNTDFFRRDPELMQSYSRHSHIMDYDMLRLGKRMLDENPNRYAFGFGVYVISEIDKERKNSPELMTVKANADECNQKTDLFNALVKMGRHGSVVANRVFVKIFADLQRPESLGADVRELGEIVYIDKKEDMNTVLPFFAPYYVFEAVNALLFGRFVDLYYEYRYIRSDKTLPMYLAKALVSKLQSVDVRCKNQFGSSKATLLLESGRMDGDAKTCRYYLQSKKIYSNRYATDCLAAIFERNADKNNVGINDLREYSTERASDEENMLQNSFFQREIRSYEKFDKNDKTKKGE